MGPKATEWPKADDREAVSVQEKGWWAWLARQGVLAVLRARTPSPAPPWSLCISCPPPAAKNPTGAPSLQQPGLAFLQLIFKKTNPNTFKKN